jgi:hypothetical protein
MEKVYVSDMNHAVGDPAAPGLLVEVEVVAKV